MPQAVGKVASSDVTGTYVAQRATHEAPAKAPAKSAKVAAKPGAKGHSKSAN